MSQQPKIAIISQIHKTAPALPSTLTGRGISLMRESHIVKFSHLAQESQISYHTNLEKVVYYHILTTIQPNNPNRGLFKIFIPSSKFLNVFPVSQSDLIANLEIQSEMERNSLVPKATLSFPTIKNFKIMAQYPLITEEAKNAILAEEILVIPPSRVIEFYKIFTPQKFLYHAIHVQTQSLMAVSVARGSIPYGQEMLEYLEILEKSRNTPVAKKFKRTITVAR